MKVIDEEELKNYIKISDLSLANLVIAYKQNEKLVLMLVEGYYDWYNNTDYPKSEKGFKFIKDAVKFIMDQGFTVEAF